MAPLLLPLLILRRRRIEARPRPPARSSRRGQLSSLSTPCSVPPHVATRAPSGVPFAHRPGQRAGRSPRPSVARGDEYDDVVSGSEYSII